MKKIVLLSINSRYIHSSLSVWALAAGISYYSANQYNVKVIETTIHQDNSDIAVQIAEHEPDIVGISTYIWNAAKLPELLKLLREKLPTSTVVLGGPEASCNAGYWLKNGADYVFHGDGERGFAEWLDNFELTKSPSDSLVRRQDFVSGVIPTTDCINPYTDDYFNSLDGRIAYIETSRGCPFSCAYCLSGGRSGLQFFPITQVKEQILKLAQSNTKIIKFVDRTFNCNAERAYDLFDFIINLNATKCFHFEVAADLFDVKTLSLVATAPPGRIQFETGIQSFHEPDFTGGFAPYRLI